MGADGAAGRRTLVRAVGTQLAGLDHREHVGQAVHERVDAVRRGVPPHVRRRVRPRPRTRREHPGVADLRPAVPRPLHLRGTATWTAHSEEVAGVRSHRHGRHGGGAGRQGGAARRQPLAATVERFNGFARSGTDEDFHRGESAYDRYYGDPTNKPNPNLGEISHGPYYAAKMVPGDLGTKGGIRHRRARPRAARRRFGDRRPLCRRQCQRTGDGPHLSWPRRHDRPGDGVRLPAALHAAPGRPEMPINLDEALGARARSGRILLDQ